MFLRKLPNLLRADNITFILIKVNSFFLRNRQKKNKENVKMFLINVKKIVFKFTNDINIFLLKSVK